MLSSLLIDIQLIIFIALRAEIQPRLLKDVLKTRGRFDEARFELLGELFAETSTQD